MNVPPQSVEDASHSYLQISIAGEIYRCATLDNWGLIDNVYGYDFVAAPPAGLSGFVGLRIETFVDKEGKPILVFTTELLEAQLKRLKPEGQTYEGATPTVSDGATTLDIDFIRTDTQQSWKCHYSLQIVEGKLRTFACEARPDHYTQLFSKYVLLMGTFCKPPPPDEVPSSTRP